MSEPSPNLGDSNPDRTLNKETEEELKKVESKRASAEYKARLRARYAKNHDELIARFKTWLYIKPRDVEFIDTGLAWLRARI